MTDADTPLLQRLYQPFIIGPLTHEEQTLYVDLDAARGSVGVVKRLETKIRSAGRPTCHVLTGHRGSGKSTELRRLQHQLERPDEAGARFFVVFCDVDQDIDRNDVDFPEVR